MDSGQFRVVVVGAGSGIGAASAEYFHRRGDHVLAVDICPNDVPASEHLQCDLRDVNAIRDLLSRVGPGWDLLAYVAGLPGTAPAADVLKVNYLGLRLLCEGMLPLLKPGGAIVGVASSAGVAWRQRAADIEGLLQATDVGAVENWQSTQDPAYPVYSTSKEAAILYTQRLAQPAWTTYGVRINTVSPGPVETPLLADFEKSMGKDVLDRVRSLVGRHATVDDIVPVIAFLGSPEAGWVIGQDIQLDGGFITSVTAGTPIQI
jgi:NAD(P)-dependent dehydrogenase (short-subunit alcohol dehydrogenase family)